MEIGIEINVHEVATDLFGGMFEDPRELRSHALHVFDEFRGYRDGARLQSAGTEEEERDKFLGTESTYTELAAEHDRLLLDPDAMSEEDMYVFLYRMAEQRGVYAAITGPPV